MQLEIRNKNPKKFVKEFSERLNRDYKSICFFLYGSVLREDFVEGHSDLDGGLIFDCDVVLPKEKIRELSKILSELKIKYDVKLGFNLTDRTTNKDGRFVSYTDDYTDHLQTEARVFSDANFLDEMCGVNYRHSSLHAIAFNLRRQRNGLLLINEDLDNSSHTLKETISNSLEYFRGIPKKLLFLQTGEWIFNKEKSPKTLEKIFPNYEQEFLKYALQLRKNPSLLDELREEEIIDLYEKSVTESEKMIKEYLRKFPSISWREARSNGIIKKLFEYDNEKEVYLLKCH